MIISMLFPYMYEHDNKALQAVYTILGIHSSVHRSLSTSVTASSMHLDHGNCEEKMADNYGKRSIWTRISNYSFIYVYYRSFHQTCPCTQRLLHVFGVICKLSWGFIEFPLTIQRERNCLYLQRYGNNARVIKDFMRLICMRCFGHIFCQLLYILYNYYGI